MFQLWIYKISKKVKVHQVNINLFYYLQTSLVKDLPIRFSICHLNVSLNLSHPGADQIAIHYEAFERLNVRSPFE